MNIAFRSIVTSKVMWCASVVLMFAMLAAAADLPQVRLATEGVAPRALEDTTQQAIVRDYAKAWQALSTAREQNRIDVLESAFVGTARNDIEQAVREQQKSGLRVRYVDRGHKLQAMFYSQEGSALQLRDTAAIETQVLDGDTIVDSRTSTINYVVLMTPAADHWQVRMLQEVPSF